MIEVLQSGTRVTIQDAGRPGYRHLGVPGGGAADKLSFALANHMVGNAWDTPALECTLGGQHFRFHSDRDVALAGAEMWAQVNGQNVPMHTPFPVKAGDILTLSFARVGCRAYVAVAGGVKGEPFLDSVSTYIPAGLGGIDGGALKIGDRIALGEPIGPRQKVPAHYITPLSNHVVLRARPGPEFYELTEPSRRHLFVSPFYATAATDRMGSRLKGDRIELTEPKSMVSAPILPGTLQIPPDGGPILALADGHCTGGYPRGLQVIRADVWLLGQIGPGMAVSFRRCFAEDAPVILRGKNAFWGDLMPGFAF